MSIRELKIAFYLFIFLWFMVYYLVSGLVKGFYNILRNWWSDTKSNYQTLKDTIYEIEG